MSKRIKSLGILQQKQLVNLLAKVRDEYVEDQDDTDSDEWYGTAKESASEAIEGIFEFLGAGRDAESFSVLAGALQDHRPIKNELHVSCAACHLLGNRTSYHELREFLQEHNKHNGVEIRIRFYGNPTKKYAPKVDIGKKKKEER